MNKWVRIFCLLPIPLLLTSIFPFLSAQVKRVAVQDVRSGTAGLPLYAVLNITNLHAWFRSDGQGNRSPQFDHGLYFPRFTRSAVYQDGVMFGAKAYLDSDHSIPAPFGQVIRVGGSHYSTGTREGGVVGTSAMAMPVQPTDAFVRIYRIRRDYSTMSFEDLRDDAAEVNEIMPVEVVDAQMDAVLAQYEKDWNEWPVNIGAPFIDRNGNGVYDPPPPFSGAFTADSLLSGNYDEPGIAGSDPLLPADQVIWTVYNDLNRLVATGPNGCEPMGLELQKTVWSYRYSRFPYAMYFTRIKIINKGGVDIDESGTKGSFYLDSMYVSHWAEIDLGAYNDDLLGCDTTLEMGFVYNSNEIDEDYQEVDLPPPAIGYVVISGPAVPSMGDTAVVNFQKRPGYRNLPMTSFTPFVTGDPYPNPPPGNYNQGVIWWYKMMRGFTPSAGPDHYFLHPPGVSPSPFPFSGDPIAQTGFLDGLGTSYSTPAGNRTLMVNTGPFQFAPGDTQEVVFATVGGLGKDRLASLGVMKASAQVAHELHQSLYTALSRPSPVVEHISNFALQQNYPNPFNPYTVIGFRLPVTGSVLLKIYNTLGQEVVELSRRELQAGNHAYIWDGRDKAGQPVASGLYFYKLITDHFTQTKKMILLK